MPRWVEVRVLVEGHTQELVSRLKPSITRHFLKLTSFSPTAKVKQSKLDLVHEAGTHVA